MNLFTCYAMPFYKGKGENDSSCNISPTLTRHIIMRIQVVIFLLLFTCLNISAKVYAQKVTLNLKQQPLEKAFLEIEKATGMAFIGPSSLMEKSKPVTLQFTDVSLEEALKATFKDQPLTYEIIGNMIKIMEKPVAAPVKAKPIKIKGRVTDKNNTPLPAVSIRVRGTNVGTVTDQNGNYTIEADPDAQLVYSSVGFHTEQIKINGQLEINLTLTELEAQLKETVVKGYYQTTKELNTGSVRTLTTQEMQRQPVGNPLQSLQGRISGLNISQQNGIPGGNFTVQLRGRNSIANGTDPLYVVDGIPYPSQTLSSLVGGNPYGSISPLNSLSIESIESITVLKDADATSIYGSQGANGVVLITTKSGKVGKTSIDANISTGWGEVERKLDLMNTDQYLEMRREALKNDGRATPRTNEHDINGNWDQTRYTDWQDVFIGGTSRLNNAAVRVSGGSNQTQFSIGSNYRKETTVFPGDYFDRKFGVQSNLTHSSENSKFKISLSSSYSINDNQLPNQNFVDKIFLAPNAPALYGDDGDLNWQNFTWTNPFAQLRQRGKTLTDNLVANTMASYELLPGLTAQVSFGYNKLDLKSNKIFPISSFSPTNPEIPTRRRNVIGLNTIKSWIAEPQLNYNKYIGKGRLELLVGSTFRESVQEILDQTASNFPSDALISNIRAAASLTTNTYGYSQYRYNALYGRAGFTWNGRYVLNLTGRRDGSSRFGPSKQFGNFGAIGAAWIFSKEDFAQTISHWLNFGKIRASYGITGNDQLLNYQYLSTYQSLNYTYLTNTGLLPSRHTNPNFGWESVKKLEIAAEFGLFKDKIRIETGWYRNRTGNQLVGYPLPMMTGFNTVQANLPAVIENRGLEIDASVRLGNPRNLQWEASFNISFPRNKVVSYPDIESSNYRTRYDVGKSMLISNRYKYTGVDAVTGLYTFADKNGDGNFSLDFDGSKIVTEGKYFGGINNTFRYREWECNIFIQFVRQTDDRFTAYGQPGFFDASSSLGNQPTWLLNRWQKPGDNNKMYQKYSSLFPPTSEFYINSDATLQDASYVRIKNVEVAWNAPHKLLTISRLKQFRIFTQAQNLLTLTKYKGLDPESGSGSALPPIRMITAGLQIGL